MPAKTKKGILHPYRMANGTMINGAIADPSWDPIPTQDNALPVSLTGNHLDTTNMELGYVPDSPIPKRNLTKSKEISPLTRPVIAVKIDQKITILMKTFLGPMRSPSMPEGISNRA